MSKEFELIRRYFAGLDFGLAQVREAVGDDCALLRPVANAVLAVSTDTLLEGVHFPEQASPELIACRALRVNLSDLAAMGAKPFAFTLAISLPNYDEDWLAAFAAGLRDTAKQFGIPLVGGDTTLGKLAITLTVMGTVSDHAALRRNRAQVGDLVVVDGTLGDGAAALKMLLDQKLDEHSYLADRFYKPAVDIDLGIALLGKAHAAIDVSDGLLADLGHVLSASGVGAQIDAACLPISKAALAAANNDAQLARTWALNGGDDYRLCFTIPPRLMSTPSLSRLELCPIGTITAGPGISLLDEDGALLPLPELAGYKHF